MQHHNALADVAPDLLRRLIWWLAILSFAHALLRLITYLAFYLVHGSVFFFWGGYRYYGGAMHMAQAGLMICSFGSLAAIVVGAWALMKWRRWGRVVLLSGAVTDILLAFFTATIWFINYTAAVRAQAATTRQVGTPLALQGWSMLVNCVEHGLFPFIVVWVMFQPEVAKLWAQHGRGGFEVVPFATPAAGTVQEKAAS